MAGEVAVAWIDQAKGVRLETLGATVALTRDADAGWGPCIDERAAIANWVGADLLLSLHADGARRPHTVPRHPAGSAGRLDRLKHGREAAGHHG